MDIKSNRAFNMNTDVNTINSTTLIYSCIKFKILSVIIFD